MINPSQQVPYYCQKLQNFKIIKGTVSIKSLTNGSLIIVMNTCMQRVNSFLINTLKWQLEIYILNLSDVKN